MLNIISRSIVSTHSRGPRKVVANLLKGLDELGYPYVVNAALDATDTLWIHDDPVALAEAVTLSPSVAIIAGPNIYTLPTEIPERAGLEKVLWLHPALWVQAFWELSAREIKSMVWPVGIDTKTFAPDASVPKDLVLVYNKQRSASEVATVCKALEARGERYSVLTYGKYQEAEYRELLKRAKAIVWVGRSESQGIGLLEALSMNVPALVWDIQRFGQWTGTGHDRFSQEQLAFTGATAIPYFDERCGRRFIEANTLETSIKDFFSVLPSLSPRAYIEENLSLAMQAQAFVDMYKTLGQSEESLRDRTIRTSKKWRNGTFLFLLATRCKDAIRPIIRYYSGYVTQRNNREN